MYLLIYVCESVAAQYLQYSMCTKCLFLCACTAVVCICVYITSKHSDEILSLLSASRQQKHMSAATSHKSRGMHRERE